MLAATWQGVVNGLALGWIYILIALGLTLIYGIMNIVQLAHGELYMLGAYLVYYLAVTHGINMVISAIITTVAIGAFGVFLERFLFRPVRGRFDAAITISIALTLLLVSTTNGLFGIFQRSLPKLAAGSFTILGSAVPRDRVVIVGAAIVFVAALYLFLRRTTQGKAMVASAQNREGAILGGIDANRMAIYAMGIGCALAAIAGVLAGTIFQIQPTMGTIPLTKGLIIIVAGGLGSILGTVLVGLFLGLIDGVLPIVADPSLAVILPMVIVIAVLLVRPQGLFGHAD